MHLTMQQLQAREVGPIICKHSQPYISIKGNLGNLQLIARVCHRECQRQEEKASAKVPEQSRVFIIQIYWSSKTMILRTTFRTSILKERSPKVRTYKHQLTVAILGPARNIDRTRKCKGWKQSQVILVFKRPRMLMRLSRSSNVPNKPDNLKISLSIKKTFWNNWTVMRFMIN